MPTKPKLKGSKDARDMLSHYFSQLTAAPSHWYLINNNSSSVVNDYDLSRLLGMTKNEYEAFLLSAGLYQRNKNEELEVNDTQWTSFASQFNASVVEFTQCWTAIPAISTKRSRYYVIRIGDKDKVDFGNKQNTFLKQLLLQKKNKMLTPRPSRALQRQLLRSTCERIIATIIREKDLYEAAMNALDEIRKKKSVTTEDCTTSKQHPPSPSGVAAPTTSTTSKTAVEASTLSTSQSASQNDAPPPTKNIYQQQISVSPYYCSASLSISSNY